LKCFSAVFALQLCIGSQKALRMIKRLFVEHPESVGESYLQHMGVAASFGWAMAKASCACFVHAVVPGLCVKTGSGIIRDLHCRMVTNRVGHHASEDEAMLWLAANI
jgi:uncharacterized membrane protein YeiH